MPENTLLFSLHLTLGNIEALRAVAKTDDLAIDAAAQQIIRLGLAAWQEDRTPNAHRLSSINRGGGGNLILIEETERPYRVERTCLDAVATAMEDACEARRMMDPDLGAHVLMQAVAYQLREISLGRANVRASLHPPAR